MIRVPRPLDWRGTRRCLIDPSETAPVSTSVPLVLRTEDHVSIAAIEVIIPWDVFTESITEAEKLAQPENFDHLALIGDGFTQLRRYTPTLLEALTMKGYCQVNENSSGSWLQSGIFLLTISLIFE